MSNRRIAGAILALIAVMLLLSGCSIQRERTFKLGGDWSRGQRVGRASIPQPVGLAVDEEGAYLLWGQRQEEGTRLSFARMTPSGTVALTTTLPFNTFFPRLPQLVLNDELHGFVITRLAASERDGVYHLRLNRSGDLLADPLRLSSPDQLCELLSVMPAPDGSIHLLWAVGDGSGKGVYHLKLGPDGSAQGFPQLIGPNGREPTGQVDQSGALHIAWMVEVDFDAFDLLYTTIPEGESLAAEPVRVTDLYIPASDITQPLSLSLDATHAYIFWSQEHRAGLKQGAAELFFVSFPLDGLAAGDTDDVLISTDPDLSGWPTDRFPPLTSLVLPGDIVDWSGFVEGPSALDTRQRGAALVLADATFSFRFKERPQLVLLLFEDGEFAGYQQPVRTRKYSHRPRGLLGDDGQLHMAWIDMERPGNYSLYYASTDPDVRAGLSKRTANDMYLDSLDLLWGMASGLSLIPLVFVMLAPVLGLLAVFYFTGQDDALASSRRSQITLLVVALIYLWMKILVFGPVLERPPLARSIPVEYAGAWVYVMLAIVAGLAGLALWRYYRRSDRPELFRGALTFVLTDVALTLLLYGPTFYGE